MAMQFMTMTPVERSMRRTALGKLDFRSDRAHKIDAGTYIGYGLAPRRSGDHE